MTKTIQARIKKITHLKNLQDKARGNDDYHLGIFNGIELALSIMENRLPEFKFK